MTHEYREGSGYKLPYNKKTRHEIVFSMLVSALLFTVPVANALQDLTPDLLETETEPSLYQTYIIAVPERLSSAREFLSTVGLKGIVHNATLKSTLVKEDLIKEKKISADAPLTMGEVACTMSHKAVYKRFLADPSQKYALIFEDDAIVQYPVNKTGKTMTEIIQTLISDRDVNDNWNVLQLGRCFDHCCEEEGQSKPIPIPGLDDFSVVSSTNPYCGHSYIVTREGATALLEHGTPIWNIIDEIMVNAGNVGKTRMRSVVPRLFTQKEESGTLIHTSDIANLKNNPQMIALLKKPECEWETHCIEHRPADYVPMEIQTAEMIKKYSKKLKLKFSDRNLG